MATIFKRGGKGSYVIQWFDAAEQGKNFLLGFLADGAGVHQNQVRVFHMRCACISRMKEQKLHAVRIRYIHLTTESIHINLFHRHKM